jgi:sugar phosphate isomerase/epimerase
MALDEGLLSINQITTRDQWSLAEAIEGYARGGVHGIAVWRDKLAELGRAEAKRMLQANGMTVTGLCVGGLLTSPDAGERTAAVDENRRVIDEAADLGAHCIVFVAGGVPEGTTDLVGARERALDGLAAILPEAEAAGVTIGLEPLHPMVCASRGVLSTLGQANDWCDRLASNALGVVVDVYHVWWDPDLEAQIARAGKRICAFHINDWLADTCDLRLDRGMMGDGVIDIPRIRALVEAQGYTGFREVEIFSERNWWKRDPEEVVRVIRERYQTAV